MSNLFEALALPVSLTISKEDIDDSWRKLSQEFHPDLAGEEGSAVIARINEARETLSKPGGLLEEWLKSKCDESSPRNAALSEDLMTVFSAVSDLLRDADSAIASLKSSQTALAKSLLMPKAIASQLAIQEQLGEITTKIDSISARFPGFEESEDYQQAQAALGELKFLDKWQRECQQRLLELIAID